MKLGLIVRADKTGLGNQTYNLAQMLKPDKILIIDSTPFNQNEQFFDQYKDFDSIISNGFPDDSIIKQFLKGLNVVLTCETFYSPKVVIIAKNQGVKTINQFNYEFLDNLINPRAEMPTLLLSPSYWHLEELQNKFPNIKYLPPPIFPDRFEEARNINKNRTGKPRFLHIVGRQAVMDRNGTYDLLKALKFTRADFELVVKVQTGSPIIEQFASDSRVIIDHSSPENEADLYKDFDALILPRRYAGQCLPMNEALMSGLPVIMTNIDPNNKILPTKWLVPATKVETLMTRVLLPVYSASSYNLADKITWLCNINLVNEKEEAYNIAYSNYSPEILLPKYKEILT